MPVKFSAETRVANAVYKYLQDLKADVVQLVPPGGQARVSITFSANGAKRTIYPDVLALFEGMIWVGEMKPRFSLADKRKLIELRTSSDGIDSVRSVVSRYLRTPCDGFPLSFCLFHGDVHADEDPEIAQLCFGADGTVIRK